jgi:undecaprenyl-diphosphatase
MDTWLVIKAFIMGIVEGLTEFFPVSSTGHLIVVGDLLKFASSIGGKETADTFEIFIQLGAVLAVVVYFARDLFSLFVRAFTESKARRLLINLLIAFVPAAGVGFLLGAVIKQYLFSPITVAIALILGGMIMLLVESRPHRESVTTLMDIESKHAIGIGLAQIAALFPGVSRSASTLIGGMLMGLDRPTSLRFSFYLSIPTLGVATVYDFLKSYDQIQPTVLPLFIAGLAASFIVALAVIEFFLGYVARHDLKPFAVYRIVAGVLFLGFTAWKG